ncbi:MAG: MlaE family lipid ABC transporter permease subunit [Planctomycetota bacterium]
MSFKIEPAESGVRVVPGPALTAASLLGVPASVRATLEAGRVVIDCAAITEFDSTGIAFLLDLLRRRGAQVRVVNVPPTLTAYIQSLPLDQLLAAPHRRAGEGRPTLLASTGESAIQLWQGIAFFGSLALEFAYWVFLAPFKGIGIRMGRVAREINLMGVDAIPIVSLVALLMGIILAFQAAQQLALYGADIYAADLVGVSLTRELGPIITAILVAGRSGSSIAAEFGTMVVTEEVDALRVMGINPTAFLVVPKLLALAVVMPCLVMLSDLVGIAGGMLVAIHALDLNFPSYYQQTRAAVHNADIFLGLVKSVIFAILIGLTASTFGLRVRGGAEEVGHVTTATVVTSFFLVIVADALFSFGQYFIR